MRGLSKLKSERGLWWKSDAEIPEIGINDVLIKIKTSAICGTDLHIYNWDEWARETIPVPMIVGHEYVGKIVKTGAGVKHLKEGDRVSGEGHIVCGKCRNCRGGNLHLCRHTKGVGVNRQGSFAEYLAIPAQNVFPVPDSIEDDIAAIFDPLGNAVHTALSFDLVGEDVLITGAGPIGIMSAAICRHVGARHVVITDINPYRLKLAAQMGASRTVNISEESLDDVMEDLNMREGFDIGLEMSGHENAFHTMLDKLNNGGKMALLGIPPRPFAIDWNKVIFKGLFLKGIYGREMFETWHKMTAMLQSGLNIKPVITHRFSVDEYEKGFEAMNGGACGKVLLDWPD